MNYDGELWAWLALSSLKHSGTTVPECERRMTNKCQKSKLQDFPKFSQLCNGQILSELVYSWAVITKKNKKGELFIETLCKCHSHSKMIAWSDVGKHGVAAIFKRATDIKLLPII